MKLYTLENKFIKEDDYYPDNFTGIIEWANGTKEWLLEGKTHRLDEYAREYSDGSKQWFFKGKLHRIDGPAIEDASGTKASFVKGKLHRIGGPAIEDASGSKSWYINDKQVTKEEHDLLYSIMKLKGLT